MTHLLPRLRNDTLCGLFFLIVALAFGWAASDYELGSVRRMGPGFFPLMVAVILGLFGLVIVTLDLIHAARGEAEEIEDTMPPAWRPGLIVMASLVLFGATATGLGLVPSLALTVLLASRAGHNSWRQSLIQCVVLTILCTVIFQMGLGLQLPLFGSWLSGPDSYLGLAGA